MTIKTERPNNTKGLLYYPFAQIVKPEGPSEGTYANGYPKGCVIHFTAGRDATEADARNSLDWGHRQGWNFFVITPEGRTLQSLPLNKWAHHAGVSKWPGLGRGVSRHLVGIEVACAGAVEKKASGKWKPWFNAEYAADEVRTVNGTNHGCQTGTFRKFRPAQEEELVDLICWLKFNNPEVFDFDLVLGHHEVSGMQGLGYWRKPDPGGSLSMSMSDFRTHLSQEYENRYSAIVLP